MGTTRQHALALVEAQHHLLIFRRLRLGLWAGLGATLGAILVALAELPLAVLPEDDRGDMS